MSPQRPKSTGRSADNRSDCSDNTQSPIMNAPFLGAFWTQETVDRFWVKVDRKEGECWLWTASTTGQMDHGQFTYRVAGKQVHIYAHRFSWELHRGAIPDGLCVLHQCDVPRCVNPDHLFLGTKADNLADARNKGRLIDGLGARKLSDDAYREILATPIVRGSGTGNALAAKYGVSKITISKIRHRKQGITFHRQQVPQSVAPEPQQPLSAQDAFDRVFERVPHVVVPSVDLRGEVR